MKKVGRSKMIIVALVVLSLVLFASGFFTHSKFVADKLIKKEADRIKAQYEKILSDKDALITEKTELLKLSEDKYNRLKAKIKEKVEQSQHIQQPQTSEELRKRFTDLGYPAK